MFADDPTIYAIGSSVDSAATSLNNILGRLYDWCCCNCLTPHPGKSEVTFLSRRVFIGQRQTKLRPKKLNLFRCLNFLPINVKAFFKVILPSAT